MAEMDPAAAGAPQVPWLRPFHVMAKPVGPTCNLQCGYCFYRDKDAVLGSRPAGTSSRMSLATLEHFIRDYIASQPGDEVQFAWQGGEPTLAGVEFFEAVVALQRQYAAGRRVTNALQTNGVLLDDDWGRFLAKEKFLVGLSLDGPKAMHDAFRVDRNGHPTWALAMRGLRVLKRHRVEFNTLTVIHRRNVRQPRQVYDFLREEGSGFMQFIPLVERRPTPAEAAHGLVHAAPNGVRDRVVPREIADHDMASECALPDLIGEFLVHLYDRWVKHDVGRVFVQTFDVTLAAWMGRSSGYCAFEKTCGRALALEHNGDLYACDHFVYPGHRFGNLHATSLADLGHSSDAERFGDAKADLPRICLTCPVRFACNGDCPKHRFVAAGENEPAVSYLCPAYRRFFTHIGPTMERMAALVSAGRPASDVMRTSP